jgi:hypothetical protein
MSHRCDAILYTGTPATANNTFPVLGAFATNGDLTLTGTAGKRFDKLGSTRLAAGLCCPSRRAAIRPRATRPQRRRTSRSRASGT